MQTTEKTFSIIIPTWNAASRISVPLHSIISQCYNRDKYEIIVVCDSCTDGTEEIAKQYADKVLKVENHNTGLTRSAGLDAAAGKWVLFMDDDDRFLHEYALAQLDRYAQQDNFDILVFGFIFGSRGIALAFDNCGYIFPNVWSKMWRREFIGETRFENAYMNDDEIFCKAMFEKKPRVSVSDAVLYYYDYMRPGSQTDAERIKNASY